MKEGRKRVFPVQSWNKKGRTHRQKLDILPILHWKRYFVQVLQIETPLDTNFLFEIFKDAHHSNEST